MIGNRSRRLVATGAVLGALIYGSAFGDDDIWPFGPLNQYSFRIDRNGEVRSLWLDADDTTGRHARLDISSAGQVGVARAELEGQLHQIIAHPDLLQGLAEAWSRLHPGRPALTGLTVGQDVVLLHQGRAAGRRHEVFTHWDVR